MIYYIRNSIEGLIGFYYNKDKYYYIKNNLEDITGILDSNYNLVASYTYDSWGNIISIRDSNGLDISTNETHIANINPYRYRSYYYDIETNLYYLNSRYYNPQWGRFLNADGIIGSSSSILGNNLYNYCYNHPIGKKDLNGFAAMDLASILISGAEKTAETVLNCVNNKDINKKNSYNDVRKQQKNSNSNKNKVFRSHNNLPYRGEPGGYAKMPDGSKERWYNDDGFPSLDWHHTNHGNPKQHPYVPHDHDWGWDEDGNWKPGKGYPSPKNDNVVEKVVIVATVSYLAYTGIKWFAASILSPFTGGGSYVVAGVMP